MAKTKKLNRWLGQLEAMLNDGTDAYPVLDQLINDATWEISLIKTSQKQSAAQYKKISQVELPAAIRRHVLVLHGGPPHDERL